MPNRPPARVRRWQATLIITLFLFAVAAAAAGGWWYARESPPHQGPIVLISIDGIPASALPAYGQRQDTPGIDALASDAVVFDRAYTHSPQVLPAHASIFSGQLPLEHGVRDDAGFVLKPETRTLAELLRNRGFATGAAVSSVLLRPESGVSQGFTFYDSDLESPTGGVLPIVRSGAETITAAERWARSQSGQRYFLFVQVAGADADEAVTRLTQLLKERNQYDKATVVLVGDRGQSGAAAALDDATLHVPLLVKQPGGQGSGRHVSTIVQHADLLPTLLDLVRAPMPGNVQGRSLRAVLDKEGGPVPAAPVYSESLSAYFRFGGQPQFAVTTDGYRYYRGADEQVMALDGASLDPRPAVEPDAAPLRGVLDRIIADRSIDAPGPVTAADEDRLALTGYLPTLRSETAGDAVLDAAQQAGVAQAHRAAAQLVGQRRFSAAIRGLQAIVREHPSLAIVHYQIGGLLLRTGRVAEAIEAFRAAAELRPDAIQVQLSLATALMRDGRAAEARQYAGAAIAIAEARTGRARSAADVAAAHEAAARVALALKDTEQAAFHADAVKAADATIPMPQFVQGKLLLDAGQYNEALAAFEEASRITREHGSQLSQLHLHLGDALSHLDRHADAEVEFREELHQFPHDIQAYTSLAMLYRAMNRAEEVEDVLNELVEADPTPEGYAVAARLWTILGDRSRAEALRSDARARFPGDPSLALLGRDARR